MAQLEARQDLSVLLRVLLFLPYVSRDKLLCSPSVLHCLPALASHQSSSKQDLCTERMKKGFCLLAVVLIQHNVVVCYNLEVALTEGMSVFI